MKPLENLLSELEEESDEDIPAVTKNFTKCKLSMLIKVTKCKYTVKTLLNVSLRPLTVVLGPNIEAV